jgi:RNA polymerase subunit RPABC4/transcription elongation factor Spt4
LIDRAFLRKHNLLRDENGLRKKGILFIFHPSKGMIYCSNCRQSNDDGTNFCRSCGHQLGLQTQPLPSENSTSPRPYMWKTDEFQIDQPEAKTRQLNQLPQVPPPYNPQPLSRAQNPQYIAGYRCPRCGTQNMPYITRQVSTAGWITFSVLLVTTFIFFWIGLLIKEDVRVCPVCNYKYT